MGHAYAHVPNLHTSNGDLETLSENSCFPCLHQNWTFNCSKQDTHRVAPPPTRHEVIDTGSQLLIIRPSGRDLGSKPLAIPEDFDDSPLPLSTNLRQFHPTDSRAASQQLHTPESLADNMPPGCHSIVPFNVHQDDDGTSLDCEECSSKFR